MFMTVNIDNEFNFPVIPDDVSQEMREFLIELRGLLMRKLVTPSDFVVPGNLVVNGNLHVHGNVQIDGEITGG